MIPRLCILAAFLGLLPSLVQAQNAAAPPKLRTLKAGDWWEYTSGAVIRLGDRQARITETRRVSILGGRKTSPKGVECLIMAIDSVTQGLGPPQTSHSEAMFTQDADGNFIVHGRLRADEDGIQWVDEPSRGWVIDIKSPFTVGTTWADDYKFTDGTTGSQTSTVQKEVGLEVPAGTFQTFRVYAQVSESDGLKVSSVDWYAPSVGATVCTMAVIKTPDGATVVTSEVLKSYGLVANASGG